MAEQDYRPLAEMVDWSRMNQPFGQLSLSQVPDTRITPEDIDRAIGLATGFAGGGLGIARASQTTRAPLAIKDAVAAADPAAGMVRLFRGGSHLQGEGPKFVTTSRKYAEGYTTPGMGYHPKAGSYLQYADIPATDPRVQMPPGQKTHSFVADPDIVSQLRPFWSPR